jgi:hypothetical protein
MPRFILGSSPDAVIQALFTRSADGRLGFGWGSLVDEVELDAVATDAVRVLDYIIEVGVSYTVQVRLHPAGAELIALGAGGNRDRFIQPAVRHYIEAAGIPITQEHA